MLYMQPKTIPCRSMQPRQANIGHPCSRISIIQFLSSQILVSSCLLKAACVEKRGWKRGEKCAHSYRSILTTSRGLNDQQKELLCHCWLKGLCKCYTRLHQADRQGCENTNPTLNISAIQCSYFLLSTRKDLGVIWTQCLLDSSLLEEGELSQADLYHSYHSSWHAHFVPTTQAADSSNHKTASLVPENGWSWPWLRELDNRSWVWAPTRSGGGSEYVLLETWLDNLPPSIPRASRRGRHRSDAQIGKFMLYSHIDVLPGDESSLHRIREVSQVSHHFPTLHFSVLCISFPNGMTLLTYIMSCSWPLC